MFNNRSRSSVVRLLIYLAIVVLVFLCGAGFGTAVLGRWFRPAGSPAPTVVFATTTAGPTSVVQATAATAVAAEPVPTPCSPLPAGWDLYRVNPGETLSELAEQAGVSQEQIIAVNCLETTELLVGQTLYLPLAPTPTPCSSAPPEGWELTTVQPGDTLISLAVARGISTSRIMRVNCMASPELFGGEKIYLPPLPTPTPCVPAPPAGWGSYTVQQGDNLSSLATARGVTTDEIMQVNCLTSSDLAIGQTLQLPLPTPTPTAPPTPAPLPTAEPQPDLSQPTQPEVEAPAAVAQAESPAVQMSGFSRRRTDLPDIPPLTVGRPDDRWPCAPNPEMGQDPWIDVPGVTSSPEGLLEVEIGTRVYFFVCNFPYDENAPVEKAKLTARVIRPNQRKDPLAVTLQLPPIERYTVMGSAQGVVIWHATCNLPLGDGIYTLIVQDSLGHGKELPFKLKKPKVPHKGSILVVPHTAGPGTAFQVYYCNYKPGTRVTVDLYYNIALVQTALQSNVPPIPEPSDLLMQPADSWEVFIDRINDDVGWTSRVLLSAQQDLPGLYLLQDRDPDPNTSLTGSDKIWLFR